MLAVRGVFMSPSHSICRVLNFWLTTVGCWIIEEFLCCTKPFAYFSPKQADLSSIQDNLAQNLSFQLTIDMVFEKFRVLISKINTPLLAVIASDYLYGKYYSSTVYGPQSYMAECSNDEYFENDRGQNLRKWSLPGCESPKYVYYTYLEHFYLINLNECIQPSLSSIGFITNCVSFQLISQNSFN